ncbi:unnamed protein product, partial [Polarella glacialis]
AEDEGTLSLVLSSSEDGGSPICELLGSASLVCAFSRNLEARLLGPGQVASERGTSEQDEDEDLLFFDGLPAASLEMQSLGDAASWRRILAELHNTPLSKLQGLVSSPPLWIRELRLLCLCAPSVADVRIMAGESLEQAWEFRCSGECLCAASPFFAAALGESPWIEGKSRELCMWGEDARAWQSMLLHMHNWPQGIG